MTKYFVWVTNRDDGLIIRSSNPIGAARSYLEKKDREVSIEDSFAYDGRQISVSTETDNGELCVIVMKSSLKIEYYWDNKSGGKFVKGPNGGIVWESHPHE